MRVSRIVARICSPCLAVVHVVRWTAVLAVIESIVRSRRLSLSAIGRAMPGPALAKHNIKRVDRLLANPHLRGEHWFYFEAVARWLLRDCLRPVILVDWTMVAPGYFALVAATPVAGRALPIYQEVHRERVLANHRVEIRFLRTLRTILPEDCRPTVVTDAGFRGPFFREVLSLGWHFVGRVRGNAQFRLPFDGPMVTKDDLYKRAKLVPADLGSCQLYAVRNPMKVRLVLVRSRRRPGPPSPPSYYHKVIQYRGMARDPWLLATSLEAETPEQVVGIYALRMKIEETFRDVKNHRFGWSLHHVRSKSTDRLTVLLLLASLAMIAVTLLGFATERNNVHRSYQANTDKRRVLSLFVLGLAVLARGEHQEMLQPRTFPHVSLAFAQHIRAFGLDPPH